MPRVTRIVALVMILVACTGGTPAATTVTARATSTTPPSTAPSATSTVPATTTSTTTSTTAPPPEPFDPHGATILEMQQAMAEGRLTSVALVSHHLDRIAAYDPQINAFVTINEDALEEARLLDLERESGGARGPLHGIPVVVKDNFDTFDMPTTAGSVALAGFVPPDDAFQVARLRAAGAIILGKANMQEWARSIHGNSSIIGRTLSPYDPSRNVGGSSAGTAAAVTAELAVVGLGTDTCGSIRVPAAYNSLWGLRPTVGLSSRSGVVPLSTSEDTAGPLARSMTDLAVVLDATVGEDPDDPATTGASRHVPTTYTAYLDPAGLEGARIGVVYSLFGAPGPVYRAVEEALDDMESAGATIVPVEVPRRSSLIGGATGVFLREWPFATRDYLAARPGAPISSLDDVLASGQYLPETGGLLRQAVAITSLDTAEYRAAVAARDTVADAVTATMDDHDLDVLAYPSISISPAGIGVRQRGNNCAIASVGGLPALSMPAGLTGEGLAIGVEILGRRFDEPTLIRVASGYEAASDPRVAPPTTPPLED